jgi:ribonuclease HI
MKTVYSWMEEIGTGIFSGLHAEAMAALLGLERAASLGTSKIIIGTDPAKLGSAIIQKRWIEVCMAVYFDK